MKQYPQKYEKVFSGERALKRLNWDNITVKDDEPIEIWGKKVSDLVQTHELEQFDFLVKFCWLFRRFSKNGMKWIQNQKNGMQVSGAIGVWSKNYGNFNFTAVTNDYINKKIFTYFDDFFPNFDLGNPIENRYEYPYEYMWFSHLVLVYQMKERLELLKIGEDKRMSYAEFSDFILNYILSYNEEHGETYKFIFSSFTIPYIKRLKK